jgi:hypothetical protein
LHKEKTMQAIIFADRKGNELTPLCDATCPALLQVANRPLLEYTLEDLSQAGVEEAFIVVSQQADQIEAHFAKGEMWGMRFHYLLSRGEEAPEALLERYASLLAPEFLALRGDLLRPALCRDFFQVSRVISGKNIEAVIDGDSAGLYLVRHHDSPLPGLAWPPRPRQAADKNGVYFKGGLFSRLQTPAELHHTALRLLDGHYDSLTLVGCRIDQELNVGRLSRYHTSSLNGGRIMIGDRVNIDPTAQLAGPLVIGHGSYIDRNAQLSNCLIMPGTYVGEGLAVENAIVMGQHLLRIDRDSHIPVTDPLLLAPMDHEVKALLTRFPDRLLAWMLLLLSLPLWPLSLLAALINSPGQPFLQRHLLSNLPDDTGSTPEQRQATAWQFATRIPLLRNLPLLWLVIRGDLRLFGSEPLTPGRALISPSHWDYRHENGTAGLLGPALLELPEGAPEEEIRLTEMVFLRQTGIAALARRLIQSLRLLFSTRAWRAMDQAI